LHHPQAHHVSAPEPLVSAVVGPSGRKVPAESAHFGSLLLARRMITAEQLSSALATQEESPYLRIGEILLGLGYITFNQLRSTLEDQYHDVRLGQTMLRRGLVSVAQIEAALGVQERSGARLGPILIELGACSEADLYQALASQESA